MSRYFNGCTIRILALILAFAGAALAQTVPARITTINQTAFGRAVFDTSGNAYYLAGQPTAGSAQTQPGGGTCTGAATGMISPLPQPCPDVHVIKVSPSGNQIWGTLLGGPNADIGAALAVDIAGNVVVTGSTGGQFPITSGAAIGSSTRVKVFATKISSDGSTFLYSTYLPEPVSASSSIAADAAGHAYIAGTTSAGHAFIVKLSPDGSNVLYNCPRGLRTPTYPRHPCVTPASTVIIHTSTKYWTVFHDSLNLK